MCVDDTGPVYVGGSTACYGTNAHRCCRPASRDGEARLTGRAVTHEQHCRSLRVWVQVRQGGGASTPCRCGA